MSQKIPAKKALLEVIAIRRMLGSHLNLPLVEPQLLVSTKICEAVIAGGSREVPLLWCRRFGKTEMLVQTAITLGIYWIHRLHQNFSVGLVNPTRNEQSIMVTKQRLQEHLAKLEPWLMTLGVTKVLGDGRKTPEYILRDSSGAEFQIRAISANPSAHEKGAGFQLMLLEQVEEMDEETMKTIIFPMAAGKDLASTQILAGTPSLQVLNDYFRERTQQLRYPFIVDCKTAGKFRPSYQALVDAEQRRLGEESDEFRTQYGCEWIQLRNKLIEREQLLLLQKDYTPDPTKERFAGTDTAKQVDSTVCTVLERAGEHLIIIAWLELEDVDYEEQADRIAASLKKWDVTLNIVDATGTQDMMVDMLTARCRRFLETEGFKFTAESNDTLYKQYERELRRSRLWFAANADPNSLRKTKKGIGDVETVSSNST